MNWSSLPPLAALRAFSAYAETGSVQRAGDALNVSHAAISQQIRNLEEHIGLRLLDRTARQARLTPAGHQLARALSEGFDLIKAEVAALTGAESARALHISTTPSFAAGWLMPRLADFRAAHPEIDLMIDPNPALNNPAPGGVDVAIRYGAGPWPGLDNSLLVRSGVAVVAAPSLIGTGPIGDLTDLMKYTWLQELGTNETSQWVAEFGITDGPKGTRTGGLLQMPGPLLLEAARAGQGITVSASIWVRDDVACGRLRLLHEARKDQGYHIVTRPGVARPALKAFLRWLRRIREKDTSEMYI
ncbi:LysR family transcriptional regulator [Roseobacteraceae bacterium S113]